MKRRLLTTSAIFSYIFTFIYAFVAALYYSVNENIYWLYLGLMVVSICIGLYNETLKRVLHYNNNVLSFYITNVTLLIDYLFFKIYFSKLFLTSVLFTYSSVAYCINHCPSSILISSLVLTI